MFSRRDFFVGLGAVALAAPLVANRENLMRIKGVLVRPRLISMQARNADGLFKSISTLTWDTDIELLERTKSLLPETIDWKWSWEDVPLNFSGIIGCYSDRRFSLIGESRKNAVPSAGIVAAVNYPLDVVANSMVRI